MGERRRSMLMQPTGRSAARQSIALAVLIFVVLAVIHRSLLFVEPWHEHSDYAVDALKIERAAQFREIHGNTSRFGFNHPGPAFYYVYALGEAVLFRWLEVVPSPYNAHAVAGLALQVFFFAAGLIVAHGWSRRPLFLPTVLFAAAIHLGLAENAFVSTWPPRVLLMPFFCFVVTAASVAAGRVRHLPLLVLAGCFLVHGHVALPLFVVPGFLAAYTSAWWRARRAGEATTVWLRTNRTAHAWSAVCIAVFLVPLLIDISAGSDSNLARIVEFELRHHGPGKPLWKALLSFGALFGYVKKPEDFLIVTGPGRSEAIGEHLLAYFVWGGVLVATLAYVFRLVRRTDTPERPFTLALTSSIVAAIALSLIWGMAQIGKMYEYNGYFCHGILLAILVLSCTGLSSLRPRASRWVGGILYSAAVAIAWQSQRMPSQIDHSTNQIPAAVASAIRLDPSPESTKYLIFTHSNWGEAASIALALKRAGFDFRGDADWGPRLMPGGGFEPTPPDFSLDGVAPWRLSHIGPRDTGAPIRGNLRVYFEPLPLDPAQAVIDARPGGNFELYMLFGFDSPGASGVWSLRPYAGLVFGSPPVESDVLVTVTAAPFSAPGVASVQPMTLWVNGAVVLTATLDRRGDTTARIPAAVWNHDGPVKLVFHFPRAVSAREHGLSMDLRQFGWHIETISFALAP